MTKSMVIVETNCRNPELKRLLKKQEAFLETRSDALQWFKSRYGKVSSPIYASKLYRPEESWTKSRVWWFEILLNRIEENKGASIHLLCQTAPTETSFHYLKVPDYYFLQQLNKLSIRDNKISIFLSAESQNRFVDQRGKGQVAFGQFAIKDNHHT